MTEFNKAVFTATNDQKPYASYKKTILGQVWVNMLDPINEQEITGFILRGNPKKTEEVEDCIIDVFSEKQNRFFLALNKPQLKMRHLIPFKRSETIVEPERTWADYTDEELKDLLDQPYAKLQKTVNTIDLPAVVQALIELADEVGKSKRTLSLLESKLSELQAKSFTPQA